MLSMCEAGRSLPKQQDLGQCQEKRCFAKVPWPDATSMVVQHSYSSADRVRDGHLCSLVRTLDFLHHLICDQRSDDHTLTENCVWLHGLVSFCFGFVLVGCVLVGVLLWFSLM